MIVTLEISSAWNTRSRNRRHAGLSASPNNERLRRRITPADGNETKMSRALIKGVSREARQIDATVNRRQGFPHGSLSFDIRVTPTETGHSYYILYFTSMVRLRKYFLATVDIEAARKDSAEEERVN